MRIPHHYFGFVATILAPLLILSSCSRAKLEADDSLRKERLNLINIALDLLDASIEDDYLQALAESSSNIEVMSKWEGIDKAHKQKVWFIKEDLDAETEKCEKRTDNNPCAYAEDLKNLKRAADTYVKAYEEGESGKVQEYNQLTGVSSELLWRALGNLTKDKRVNFTEEQISSIASRLFNAQFVDDVKRMETCNNINPIFYEYARYKGHCGYDFLSNIRALSSEINDIELSEDSPNAVTFGVVCVVESKLRGFENQKAPEACPTASRKMDDIKWGYDLFLSKKDSE